MMFRTLLNKWRVYIVEIIKNVQDILGVIILKICYLILAYNDIGNLKRLVNRLNENAVFIIHIDKKTDIEPFIEAFKSYDNVEFYVIKTVLKFIGVVFPLYKQKSI